MTGVGVSRLSLDLVVWIWLYEQLLSKNPRKDTPTPVIGIRRPGATLQRALTRTTIVTLPIPKNR